LEQMPNENQIKGALGYFRSPVLLSAVAVF